MRICIYGAGAIGGHVVSREAGCAIIGGAGQFGVRVGILGHCYDLPTGRRGLDQDLVNFVAVAEIGEIRGDRERQGGATISGRSGGFLDGLIGRIGE